MKAVLISIQPKWCELIANGKKTIEVRKTKPKLGTPFKVYIYMTKSYDTLFGYGKPKKLCVDGGKVIGEFVCNKIDRIAHCGTRNNDIRLNIVDENFYCKALDCEYLIKCKLSYSEIEKYSNDGDVYGWHISNLVIYEKPRGLWELYRKCEKTPCEGCEHLKYQGVNSDEYDYDCEFLGGRIPITKPPQSWMYVEEVKESDQNAQ